MVSPGRGAVLVECVEVLAGEQLAPVDPGLDGPQSPQDPHLLHVADDRGDVQPLELGVDRVEAAHQVLEEQLEGLGQAQQIVPVHQESGDLRPTVLDQTTVVGGHVRRHSRGGGRRRRLQGSVVP